MSWLTSTQTYQSLKAKTIQAWTYTKIIVDSTVGGAPQTDNKQNQPQEGFVEGMKAPFRKAGEMIDDTRKRAGITFGGWSAVGAIGLYAVGHMVFQNPLLGVALAGAGALLSQPVADAVKAFTKGSETPPPVKDKPPSNTPAKAKIKSKTVIEPKAAKEEKGDELVPGEQTSQSFPVLAANDQGRSPPS